MAEELGKLFYVFILGVVVIAIGLTVSLLEVVLLGGCYLVFRDLLC
jgi:hypothetical protein